MSVDRYKMHDIEIVVDKIVIDQPDLKRLKASVATAMKYGEGVLTIKDYESEEIKYYSRRLMCPDTGISYKDPAPHSFSFNSPHGACPKCKGLGYVTAVDMEKLFRIRPYPSTRGEFCLWENIKTVFYFGRLIRF